MRYWPIILISLISLLSLSCARETKPSTPLDSFKAYNEAVRKKDLTTMKLLLSEASKKMHEEEAKARGITLDDVMKTQSLISENQTSVSVKDQKIEGDKATLDIKDQYGKWETIHFVLEDGVWKIDELGSARQLMDDIEQKNNKALDDIINQGRKP